MERARGQDEKSFDEDLNMVYGVQELACEQPSP